MQKLKKKGGGVNLALCLTKCLILIVFWLTVMWLSSSFLFLGVFVVVVVVVVVAPHGLWDPQPGVEPMSQL